MSTIAAYRGTVLLLWGLAALDGIVCRGLFWDGSSFLASMLETGTFHDFYPARAHIAWLTETPVLLLAKAGVRDVRLLAMVFSAMLSVVPAALYHLALHRAREQGALLAAVIAVIAVVHLPTCFFDVGEHITTYALVTATFTVALTRRPAWRDGALMLAFGLLGIASYEAMIYLGPATAAVVLWSMRGQPEPLGRMLAGVAALAFAGAALVALSTVVEYWNHDHFVRVRSAAFDFWQNLQFVIPLAALVVMALLGLAFPSWLAGRGPLVLATVAAILLAASPWLREIRPAALLFPPSHYVARTAAGGLLLGLMLASWLYVAWPKPGSALVAAMRRPAVARRLTTAMFVLVLGGAVPDLWLTRMWTDYLGWFRGVVTSRAGVVPAEELPLKQWPYRLFTQEWTYPALSVLLRSAPGQGVVVQANDYSSNMPFDPLCGTVPRLEGFAWR
jgi:hypothetical protein